MSRAGFALFVSDEKRGPEETLDFLKSYGPNTWAYDGTGNALHANKLISLCIAAWENEDSRPCSFEADKFEDGEWERLLNPEDIVDSAGIYDIPELHCWLWANVLEPMQVDAIITQDGAIVYNDSLCHPLD